MDETIGLFFLHNPWAWGIVIAFILVLAILVFSIRPNNQVNQPAPVPHIPFPTIPSHREDKEVEEEYIRCPACSEEYPSDTEDKYCYRCRYPLDSTCPDCYEYLKKWEEAEGYKFLSFCPECGYQLAHLQNIGFYPKPESTEQTEETNADAT